MGAWTSDEAATGRLPPRFWSFARRSFAWVWRAAPVPFALTLAAQLLGAIALFVVLLAGRSLAVSLTEGEPPTSLVELWPAVVALGLGLFVAGLGLVVDREARFVLGELVVHTFQEDLVEVAGSVDYERYEEGEFHDLLERAGEHGAQSAMQMVYSLLAMVSAALTSASLIVVLATTVPSILPVLVLVAVPFVLAGRASARLAYRTAYELTPADRLRFSLFGVLTGRWAAKEVRVFDLHRPLRLRWSGLFVDRAERLRRVALRRTLLNGLASLAASALVAGLLVVVVLAAIDGRVTVADAAIAMVALQQVAARIRATSSSAGALREATLFLADVDRFRALAQARPADGEVTPLPAFDRLLVEGVSFAYPGTSRVVLDDVDLEIGRGEIVALVGLSGSGKTTLAHLVAGLYRPTSGRITWDGTDVADIGRERYWRSLAAVFQDFATYELTARENISISDVTRGDDLGAVRSAAVRAEIDAVIERLPAGYETMLSRAFVDGAELSRGEWQRVAVARAFFREAPLLVLDEPAAALDAIAERDLYERLRALCVDRSALLISHRFSTVRMAHRIYVLRDGRVIEHGSHAELMAIDGHYADLFTVQAEGYLEVGHGQSEPGP
jgi:ATP-binding cassette subfamily B protein